MHNFFDIVANIGFFLGWCPPCEASRTIYVVPDPLQFLQTFSIYWKQATLQAKTAKSCNLKIPLYIVPYFHCVMEYYSTYLLQTNAKKKQDYLYTFSYSSQLKQSLLKCKQISKVANPVAF